MTNKFTGIKEEWTAVGDISGGDVNWLIAEVERLRAERIADLEEFSAQCKVYVSGSHPDNLDYRACRAIAANIDRRLASLR
jgi:hypothetical protein